MGLIEKYSLSNELGKHQVHSPVDQKVIGSVHLSNSVKIKKAIMQAQDAFGMWRKIPAPKRGEIIRLFGLKLRENKKELGELVTLECGKIIQEGLGEVQEMIDLCDFAVGLSRQLYGLTIASERPEHKLLETWHPLGPVVVISAFNFPVAVWAWNFALAIVCGNSVIWKPSEKTPFTALACQALFTEVLTEYNNENVGYAAPIYLSQVVVAGSEGGELLVADDRIKLVSATGSTRMGKTVAPVVAKRMGRSLLELGGNNAMIVTPSANQEMALKAIVFSAVGTAGQRCTTLRRLFLHENVYDDMMIKLKAAYSSISIGDPFDEANLVGPLIDLDSYSAMISAIKLAKSEGGKCHGGLRETMLEPRNLNSGYYVRPCLMEMSSQTNIVKTETFAPILYIMKYSDLDDVMILHNDVPQGLSSSIFTTNILEAEKFLVESDCGIANVNIGTSGAEIGGSFGGEKETGGGRESGTDSWRAYMRRATNTINYSEEMPLAQGIKFNL